MKSLCEKLKTFSLLNKSVIYSFKLSVPHNLSRTVFKASVFPVLHADEAWREKKKAVFFSLYGVFPPAHRLHLPKIIFKHNIPPFFVFVSFQVTIFYLNLPLYAMAADELLSTPFTAVLIVQYINLSGSF